MDKKRRIKYGLIGFGSLFGFLFICWLYLYVYSFDIVYELKTGESFYKENKITQGFLKEGNKIEMEVPVNVINTEILMLMEENPLHKHYKIENLEIDPIKKEIHINGSIYSIKVPISMPLEFNIEENKLVLFPGNIRVGKHDIKLNNLQSDWLKQFLLKDSFPIVLDLNLVFKSNFIKINKIEWSNDGFKVYAGINVQLIKQEIKKIKAIANEEILNNFENSKIESEIKAAQYINNVDQLSEQDLKELIEDILSKSEIVSNILLLAETKQLDELFKKYEQNLNNINKNELFERQYHLLGKILSSYRGYIFNRLEEHYFSSEPMYINKGQPYSMQEGRYITITQILKEDNNQIPENTIKKLGFCYDKITGNLLISYKLDQDNYLISKSNEVTRIDLKAYQEKFTYPSSGRVSRVHDVLKRESLEKEIKSYFQTEKVFIRYMKADDQYAFVVASPDYSYQSYRTMVFENKNGVWEILDENVRSLSELNKKHPLFNLETATIEIETVTIYHLGDEMFHVILEDLVNKKILSSKDEYSIEYCSYGENYISFLLSNGEEYVYKVYRMYLQTVYDKEKAENLWEDLPEIITLQE